MIFFENCFCLFAFVKPPCLGKKISTLILIFRNVRRQVDVVVVVNVVKPLERDIQLTVSCVFLSPVTINNKKILETCGARW